MTQTHTVKVNRTVTDTWCQTGGKCPCCESEQVYTNPSFQYPNDQLHAGEKSIICASCKKAYLVVDAIDISSAAKEKIMEVVPRIRESMPEVHWAD